MRDPRILANLKNLESYRAWEREGLKRSGFATLFLIAMLFAPMLTFLLTLIEHAARGDARAMALRSGAALVVYLAALLGLMLFGVRRLHAWKRTHPWAPPSRVPRQALRARA